MTDQRIAWTAERGWHTITEAERRQMQARIVARILSPIAQRVTLAKQEGRRLA